MQAVTGGEGPVGAKGRDSGRVNRFRELYALVANGGEKQLGTRLPIGARGDDMGCEALSARDGGRGQAWTLAGVACGETVHYHCYVMLLLLTATTPAINAPAPTILGPPRAILSSPSFSSNCLCLTRLHPDPSRSSPWPRATASKLRHHHHHHHAVLRPVVRSTAATPRR